METRDKKATGEDYVAGDIPKLFWEDGLRIMMQQISSRYDTGEWPKDFTEVTMIVWKKKPKATKCNNHCTISLIAHTAKMAVRILRTRIERKIEDVFGEDRFGFRKGKGIRMQLGCWEYQQTLDMDKEMCACFIDWQKACDGVNWTKLMQIVKGTGINWCKGRLISKLYMDQSVKLKLDQEETRRGRLGEVLDKDALCCWFSSTYTGNILPRKLLKGLEISK